MGLSHAIAGFSAFFMLRIQDAFGNFASQDENVTVAFELPEVPSHARGLGAPTQEGGEHPLLTSFRGNLLNTEVNDVRSDVDKASVSPEASGVVTFLPTLNPKL